MLLPGMQKTCSFIDRRCTRAALTELTREVSASMQFLHMFAHDKGIASSQLEGASTTRTVAKQMLEEKRESRSEGEQMILGNHRLMQLTWESRHEDMTLPLLLQFHATACKGIDDDKYSPGTLRDDDSVYVAGRDDEIIHVPPSAALLPELLGSFVNWINIQHEENVKPSHYIHPVIKACIMHFSLGYIHPFFDGNGRVARALCYWQLFRHGYELFKYVSISKLLKVAPIQYGEAYLKTETDHLDVTYFVDYQCRIFERAVNETLEHVRESSLKLREFNSWLFNHGFLSRLSDIQIIIFNEIIIDPESRFLVSDFSKKAGISESAARQNLEKLFEAGLLLKSGGGGSKPVVYTPKKSLDKIKQALIEMNKK